MKALHYRRALIRQHRFVLTLTKQAAIAITSASVLFSPQAPGAVIYQQSLGASTALLQSSWWDPNGSDYDQYVWDSFNLASNQVITEIQWQGGYINNRYLGSWALDFTVAIYDDVANGYQPNVVAQLLVSYQVGGNANETAGAIVGGIQTYNYSFTLPSPFQVASNRFYWVQIEAWQHGIPDWGIAKAGNGNGGYFRRLAGMGDILFQRVSGDATFTLLGSDGPAANIDVVASPAGAGSVQGGGVYPVGTIASLLARPNPGYGLLNWTENGAQVGTSPTYSFTVSTNRTLTANFVPAWTVSVSAAPTYAGTASGGGSFNDGTSVAVVATAAFGYSFVNWTEFGTPVSDSASYTFPVNANRTLVANFSASAASATFDFDTGWPPVGPTQGLPNLQSNNNIIAYFSTSSGGWSVQNNIAWWVPGVFSGSFLYSSSSGGALAVELSVPVTNFSIAFCTADNAGEYDVPTTVQLTAYTNSAMTNPIGSNRGQGAWLTGAYPEGTISFNSVTSFTKVKIDMPLGLPGSHWLFLDNIVVEPPPPPPCVIAATASPAQGGTISGSGSFPKGDWIFLSATPTPGFSFLNWTENGVPVSSYEAFSFMAESNRTLLANFAPAITISTAVGETNAGWAGGGGVFPTGATVGVVASPRTGFHFLNWSENGLPVSLDPHYVFTATSNRLLIANFTPDNVSVTFDFDSAVPALTNSQTSPFDQTARDLTAHFSSPTEPAFVVVNDAALGWSMPNFFGNYLFPGLSGSPLDIQFNQPLDSIALTFATWELTDPIVPSTIQLAAYADSMNAPVASVTGTGTINLADSLPVSGLLSLRSSTPFNLVRVSVLSAPLSATDFLVDNVTVTTVPSLQIRSVTNYTVVSWTTNSDAYALLQSTDLMGASWSSVTNAVTVIGSEKAVVLAPVTGSSFFRLSRP